MLFPAYLIFTALSLWLDVIARFGGWGAGLALLIVVLVIARLIVGYLNIARESWRHQRSRLRILAVSALTATGVALSAAYVEVPTTIHAGFVNDAAGPGIVFDGVTSLPPLQTGQAVDVYASGLVGIRHVGSINIESTQADSRTVPLDTLAPVVWDDVQLKAAVIPLLDDDARTLPSSGTVRIHLKSRNVYQWMNEKYLQPVVNSLKSAF